MSVHGGFGYKDNLLLSYSGKEKSAFARGGVDAMWWRLPQGHVDYLMMTSAEHTQYFSGTTIDYEANAFLRGEWRYQSEDRFKVSLRAQGYYLDQVFDVSEIDFGVSDPSFRREIAELKLTGATLGPILRWTIVPWGWVEAEAFAIRDTYDDGANDARVEHGALRFGWRPDTQWELTIGGHERRRRYDDRAQLSISGERVLEGTHLETRERQGSVSLGVVWGDAKQWTSTTRAILVHYVDNGSGYFNYRQRGVEQEIEWFNKKWLIQIEAAAARREFEVQKVGIGIVRPGRIKEQFSATARIERSLSDRYTVFAEYAWERSRSNEAVASYVVNEGLLGVRWSWEK
jgi:hypothetical protein